MLHLEAPTSSADRRTVKASTLPTAPLLQALLDVLPQAVAVLDSSGLLAYWNAAARTRLTASGWTVVDQQLRAPCAADRDTLWRTLPDACARGRVQLIRLSLQGRPAHAALLPLSVPGQCWAVLLLDRETLCGAIELQLFASSSGLTPAESRVLSRLTYGLRPTQIAHEHGVSLTTVQSQVAALRAKTQASSVLDLLAGVARLPALQALHLVPPP